ncbi:MAG TPA: hypothetical protein VJV79_15450 [Polyangiaceae bacterium]|nr:hypothetical protein [Polyangiaceae bacterium]
MTSPSFVSPPRTATLCAFPLCLTLLLRLPSAHAQDMTEAGAQLLDAEGTALLNQRQLAAACPKLEQSYRLKPGTGVLLRLALCQELSGKWASSLAFYLEAAERAEVAGNQQIAQLAKSRAAALQPRLAHLTVDLEPSVKELADLRVSCDGVPLELTTLGAGLPLDPGSHVIEAEAPGRKRFEQTIVVSDEPRRYSIAIVLPVDAGAVELAAASKVERETTGTKPSSWSTQRSLALAAGGVGLAGLTAGTFLGLAVGSQMDRARALCSDGQTGCSEQALALQDQARGYALASTIAFSAGAVGILGGIALWLTAPERPERPRDAQVRLVPMVGIGSGGVQAVGTW